MNSVRLFISVIISLFISYYFLMSPSPLAMSFTLPFYILTSIVVAIIVLLIKNPTTMKTKIGLLIISCFISFVGSLVIELEADETKLRKIEMLRMNEQYNLTLTSHDAYAKFDNRILTVNNIEDRYVDIKQEFHLYNESGDLLRTYTADEIVKEIRDVLPFSGEQKNRVYFNGVNMNTGGYFSLTKKEPELLLSIAYELNEKEAKEVKKDVPPISGKHITYHKIFEYKIKIDKNGNIVKDKNLLKLWFVGNESEEIIAPYKSINYPLYLKDYEK
ncbi:hypothetical protein ACWKTZ_25945 [Bacillus cereus]